MLLWQGGGEGGARTGTFPGVRLEDLSFGWGLASGGVPSGVWGGLGDQGGHFLDVTVCVFGGGGGGDILVNHAGLAWQVCVNSAETYNDNNSYIYQAHILCRSRCQILYVR